MSSNVGAAAGEAAASWALPASVRYAKNGAGGRWWSVAKAQGQVHFGWTEVPDDALLSGDLARAEVAVRAGFAGRPGATADYNALRTILDQPSRHLWVTFEEGCLWWCTVRDGVAVNPDKGDRQRGNMWLSADRPWSNRTLAGRSLAMSDLPGIVTSVAGYRATVCQPTGWREILRIVGDQVDADAAEAEAARRGYQSAIGKLVARLGPKDFELLVDLVLSRAGWTRIARVGGVTEGIDLEVENAATDEIAFVQVKSAADQGVLDAYVAKFNERRDRFARMIFAVHSPAAELAGPDDSPVQVWDGPRLSDLVVRHGLGDWVTRRV